MSLQTFNLQIDMFITNTDEWENQDLFWCVYNEGHFRNTQTGNLQKFEDRYYRIGKVEKNIYNSYDLIETHDNRIYPTYEDALAVLAEIEAKETLSS